jgi:hypothetical protein
MKKRWGTRSVRRSRCFLNTSSHIHIRAFIHLGRMLGSNWASFHYANQVEGVEPLENYGRSRVARFWGSVEVVNGKFHAPERFSPSLAFSTIDAL